MNEASPGVSTHVQLVSGPICMRQPGRYAHLPLDLILVMTHRGCAVHDHAEPILGACREQQGLHQRGLPRPTMAHHRDIPDLGRVYQRHESSSLQSFVTAAQNAEAPAR